MAYIDWDRVETERVDKTVRWRLENDPREATRRGMGDIWRQAEMDEVVQARRCL